MFNKYEILTDGDYILINHAVRDPSDDDIDLVRSGLRLECLSCEKSLNFPEKQPNTRKIE